MELKLYTKCSLAFGVISAFLPQPVVSAGELLGRTAPTEQVVESITVSFEMKVERESTLENQLGFGLVLIDPEHGALGEDFLWDEPNAGHSIAIGFDVHNPPPTDIEPDENGRVMGWFDQYGNWYDRPQREISVHANGRERKNVLSDVEFRTGQWMDATLELRYVAGGAHLVLMLDSQVVFDDYIWDVKPMRMHAMMGVESNVNADQDGAAIELRELHILRSRNLDADAGWVDPVSVQVFDEDFLQNAARLKSTVRFDEVPESVSRVIATMSLTEPEVGFDHWDKKGTVGIRVPFDGVDVDAGAESDSEQAFERFEVIRFITPYRRGWVWHSDVTDLLPLFEDEREFDIHIGTYMKGWDVSFKLDFYEGELDRVPVQVTKLWSGDATIGDPDNPVEQFYLPREVEIPEGVTHARVRSTVTGHGMYPNSKNAGEFMPIWRTLTIGTKNEDPENQGDVLEGEFLTQSQRDYLWNTDVYLNPCRPQGGTWKFDRSGWAPGSLVEPWVVDVQDAFLFGDVLTVEYVLDPYLNEGRGETWSPHHWTESVVVFYQDAHHPNELEKSE